MEHAVSPYFFFDPERDNERQRRSAWQIDDAAERERRLFCARCRSPITSLDLRIAVNGQHAHSCTNPHGLHFHIGCFRQAPGCAAFGAATTEYTWFPGYAWRVADCARCGVHLGWSFASSSDSFYGLIIDRLTSAGPAKG
ncbi:MAG TPA: cereblon family protein [Burkholderiales bacterium]